MKALAAAVITSICLFEASVTVKFFTTVNYFLGIYWGFWIFALSMVISVYYVYFYVTDTKGMSLQEIQDILNRQKSINSSKV